MGELEGQGRIPSGYCIEEKIKDLNACLMKGQEIVRTSSNIFFFSLVMSRPRAGNLIRIILGLETFFVIIFVMLSAKQNIVFQFLAGFMRNLDKEGLGKLLLAQSLRQ